MHKKHIFMWIGILGLTCLALTTMWSLPFQGEDGMHYLPNKVGKWKPWTIDTEVRVDYKLTQREVDSFLGTLERLATIFRELKALTPPLGVDARSHLSLQSPPSSEVQRPRSYIPVVGRVTVDLLPYYMDEGGRIDTNPDDSAGFALYVNDLSHIFRGERYTKKGVVEDWFAAGEPTEMEDEQGLYFLAPKVTGNLQGFPIYDTAAVILVKSQKPLWVPVSQERFLRHAIRRAQELLEAQNEEQREMMKGVPPDEVREGEKLARESEAGTRATLAENPGNIRFLRADYVKALTQELASLSSEQRAAPAFYSPDWKTTRRPSGLLNPGAPQAQPVVSPNADFFNPALPRTAIQVIVVLGISGADRAAAHPERANPAVVRRFEVRNSLDWRSVAALVE